MIICLNQKWVTINIAGDLRYQIETHITTVSNTNDMAKLGLSLCNCERSQEFWRILLVGYVSRVWCPTLCTGTVLSSGYAFACHVLDPAAMGMVASE